MHTAVLSESMEPEMLGVLPERPMTVWLFWSFSSSLGGEGGREGGREGERKRGRERGREGGWEREREGGREGGRGRQNVESYCTTTIQSAS